MKKLFLPIVLFGLLGSVINAGDVDVVQEEKGKSSSWRPSLSSFNPRGIFVREKTPLQAANNELAIARMAMCYEIESDPKQLAIALNNLPTEQVRATTVDSLDKVVDATILTKESKDVVNAFRERTNFSVAGYKSKQKTKAIKLAVTGVVAGAGVFGLGFLAYLSPDNAKKALSGFGALVMSSLSCFSFKKMYTNLKKKDKAEKIVEKFNDKKAEMLNNDEFNILIKDVLLGSPKDKSSSNGSTQG
ncbi:MAG: hypothetical protein WDZ41_04420 [Candidatus Babeliales bacterium]